MSDVARPSLLPIALGIEEGEAFWFFGTLATIKASSETSGGGIHRKPACITIASESPREGHTTHPCFC